MYRIRFHLQSGRNYMKWQIRHGKNVIYIDPSTNNLEMVRCKLINKLNKAKKVNDAGVKDVSGWIECEQVMVNNENPIDNLERVFYNPIVDVHWRRDSDDGEFAWDDSEYATLITNNKQVYILEERI